MGHAVSRHASRPSRQPDPTEPPRLADAVSGCAASIVKGLQPSASAVSRRTEVQARNREPLTLGARSVLRCRLPGAGEISPSVVQRHRMRRFGEEQPAFDVDSR